MVNSGVLVAKSVELEDRFEDMGAQLLREVASLALDETSGIRLVSCPLEEPLRRIASNAGGEPSVILNRIDESPDHAFGYNAATHTYGDLLQMGALRPEGNAPMF